MTFRGACSFTHVAQIPAEFWPEARRLHALYRNARNFGDEDPLWHEAEKQARTFANAYNRDMKKNYPGGRNHRDEAFEGILATNRINGQLLAASVSVFDFRINDCTDISRSAPISAWPDPLLQSGVGQAPAARAVNQGGYAVSFAFHQVHDQSQTSH